MSRFAIFFFFVGICSCIPINDEVESYRKFLENSAKGQPTGHIENGEWEKSGKFEGDIVLTEEQQKFFLQSKFGNSEERNGLVNPQQLWPNKIVYYKINTAHFTATQNTMIKKAIDTISSNSCVKMVEAAATTKAYINIRGDKLGCYSKVGYTGTIQDVNYESGCFVHGSLVHELLHSIGFFHMQSTHDRDTYVKIVWDKILPGKEVNFEKYSESIVTNLGVAYDYGSVMHYPEVSFSADGKSKTIVALKTTDKVIGQRVGPSADDLKRLNKLYKC